MRMTDTERELRELVSEALDVWIGPQRPGALSWCIRARLVLARREDAAGEALPSLKRDTP